MHVAQIYPWHKCNPLGICQTVDVLNPIPCRCVFPRCSQGMSSAHNLCNKCRYFAQRGVVLHMRHRPTPKTRRSYNCRKGGLQIVWLVQPARHRMNMRPTDNAATPSVGVFACVLACATPGVRGRRLGFGGGLTHTTVGSTPMPSMRSMDTCCPSGCFVANNLHPRQFHSQRSAII